MISAEWSCALYLQLMLQRRVELGMSIIPPKFTVSKVTPPSQGYSEKDSERDPKLHSFCYLHRKETSDMGRSIVE